MKLLFFIVLLTLLPGCGRAEEDIVLPEMEPASLITSPVKKEEYDLYYQDSNYILSTYEPKNGCYLGGYVLSNKKINFSMEDFDQKTGKSHSIYMYNMSLGDYFPMTWVLSCVSAMKTPYIVINPPNEYSPFDRKMVDKLAESFGELYIPMFVEFYPDPQDMRSDSEEYTSFYRYARKVFADKASNVAFVWAVDAKNILGSDNYYPGDSYTDWVGLHIYDTLVNGQYEQDIFNAIDYFYYSYQKTKPITISRLAVSHYSSSDHIYRSDEAATEIKRIYNGIIEGYPRIKMINYMDFNGFDLSPDKETRDNFSITELEAVLDAYKAAASSSGYLTEIEVASTGDISTQYMKSPFKTYKIGDAFYSSEKTFHHDLNIYGLNNGRDINGANYFDMSFIEKNNIGRIVVDQVNKKIDVVLNGAQ